MVPILSIRGLAKAYAGVPALTQVDLDLYPGEIHALCGENGAGKSTLIKILAGIIPSGAYSGTVLKQGEACQFTGPGEAKSNGIVVIHQELSLALDLTVAENIFLGQELTRNGWIDRLRMEAETARLLATLGRKDIKPHQKVAELTIGNMQLVEIARALMVHPDLKLAEPKTDSGPGTGRILILDEPTSALTARESDILLDLLRTLRADGQSIVYVSHKLDEVFAIADRITVLRNGSSVETVLKADSTPAKVVQLMLGRTLDDAFPARTPPPPAVDPPLLSVRNWSVLSARNKEVSILDNISFDLAHGEILGLVGLMGAGRTELVESLFGLGPVPGTGRIEIAGRPYVPTHPKQAVSAGIALVPENRRQNGLMLQQSIRHNITSACLKQFCQFFQFINTNKEMRQTELSIHDLGIKTLHGEFPAGLLSGGNQQKVVLAKWLLTKPRLLLLDDPTRGVDIGAKAEIYRIIQSLSKVGIGILLISSENEEVLRLSHRILVLRQGHMVGTYAAAEADSQTILELCAGGAAL